VALASGERDEQGVSFLSLGRRWSALILVIKMLLIIAETDSLISLTFQPGYSARACVANKVADDSRSA